MNECPGSGILITNFYFLILLRQDFLLAKSRSEKASSIKYYFALGKRFRIDLIVPKLIYARVPL